MIDTLPHADRSAERATLQAQLDEYLRQGGLISRLDYAGKLVALDAGPALVMPVERDTRPVVHLTPVEVIPEPQVTRRVKPAPTVRPPETVAEWVERVAPAPTGKVVNITTALRRIRTDAQRALARLDAAINAKEAA
jgi:hypothetical protein